MENLLLVLSSVALVIAFLGTAWIYRSTKCVKSTYFLSALFILLFAGWEFAGTMYTVDNLLDDIIQKVFIIFTVSINCYYACRQGNINKLQALLKIQKKKKRKKK